jgi:hypothetical protein
MYGFLPFLADVIHSLWSSEPHLTLACRFVDGVSYRAQARRRQNTPTGHHRSVRQGEIESPRGTA